MALNFGVLDQGGPSNFFEGYSQGQEKMQANEMARQRAAQAQQEFGMRQQEFAAGQADKRRVADAAMVTQRMAQSRDALLRARTPDEARAIVRARHNDPYLGRISQQFGSLEADLSEVPEETSAFQQYKEREAMGAEAFLKQQYRQSQVAKLFGDVPTPAPTNAMAPAGAMPQAAPVANAMAPTAPNLADLVRRRNQALALGETAVATAINSDIERLSKSSETPEVVTMKALGYPLTQAGFQAYRDAQRQERMLNPAEEAQKIRIANASRPPAQPRPEPAPRTQQITLSDGSLGIVNMDTGAITPSTLAGAPVKGRPSATAEKAALQRKQLNLDLDRAIIELTDATKDGGLIDKSTGSGAGRLIDLAAGFGGQAMPGAIAIGELQPIADMALKMVPRFEGPQSNADTTSYKQAAGQLADPTLPREIRKKAGRTVLRLMKDRKGQFASTAMEAEGVAPAPAGATSIRDQADAILRGGN
jgi:hypothetical protein